jgi:hypothetical protein
LVANSREERTKRLVKQVGNYRKAKKIKRAGMGGKIFEREGRKKGSIEREGRIERNRNVEEEEL